MATNKNGPTADLAKIQAAYDGTAKLLPAASSETVGGVTYTQPQILSKLDGWIQSIKDVDTIRTQLKQALADRETAIAAAKEFLKDFKAALIAQLGRLNPELAQFGFPPEKARTSLTAAQKVQKAAKAKATRDLLGTKGKKQKAEAVKAATQPQVSVGPDGAISIVPESPAPKGA
ncbi:MAG: hypothetical protein ACYDCL_06850 [Myxococcales bacterium]